MGAWAAHLLCRLGNLLGRTAGRRTWFPSEFGPWAKLAMAPALGGQVLTDRDGAMQNRVMCQITCSFLEIATSFGASAPNVQSRSRSRRTIHLSVT